jgi:hypothetical protein
MGVATDCSKDYLELYQRGSLFQAADFFGQCPGIGTVIGAGRIAGSILAMFGAGFVYGGAFCFKNEALKENCLFVHERAIDETIRGIYEVACYGLGCEKLARRVASMVSSKISTKEKNHNYFAHGSHFTVDSERRIRYYTKEEAIKPHLIKTSDIATEKPVANDYSKEFIAALLKDLKDTRSKFEYTPCDTCYL